MLQRLLFFPSSPYLAGKWWHRLFAVLMFLWIGAITVYLWRTLIWDPWIACIDLSVAILDQASRLDCGHTLFHYTVDNAATESFASILSGIAVLSIGIYVALLVPIAIYRILLYISTGSTWKGL